ncbi:MAG: hypothetical protein JST21_08590 [Bacteroidetes bacterium]|nr:hypothetical protein [Bacteroidota bacterium]
MKTINRNNYEEFFLLFIDNELDAAGRLSVENFIEENPDLSIEFQMLQQTKVQPEKISFTDKETILRTEGNNICEANYEEFFLLYIDNELSVDKRAEVEKYILQHPELQESFTTLKNTVLTPEKISYGNKENLYRTEKRRTVYFKSWQWMAAAIVTGICATGIWLWKNSSITIPVTANHQTLQQPDNTTKTTAPADSLHQTIAEEKHVLAQQEKQNEVKTEQQKIFIKIEKQKKDINQTTIVNNTNRPETIKVQQQPEQEVVTLNQKEPPSPLDKIADGHLVTQQNKNNVASLQTSLKNVQTDNNSYTVYPVAYKEINTNDEDRSLRIAMFDLNKNKVKGFFKKAGRMFGNKKNITDRDGKLQVAGFEIETNQ